MADAITIKALQDASLDAKSLSEFIFKPTGFMVSRRLAPPVNTLQYYIDMFENISIGGEFNSAKIASLTVSTGAAGTSASVVTGGTPSNRTFALTIPRGDKGEKGDKGLDGSFIKKAYTTEALMIADKANIPPNTSVDVTNDPTSSKNGMYAYNGTVFTKSDYDPLAKAKEYADTNSLAYIKRRKITHNSSNVGWRVGQYTSTGFDATAAGKATNLVPVINGVDVVVNDNTLYYTVIALYDADKNFIKTINITYLHTTKVIPWSYFGGAAYIGRNLSATSTGTDGVNFSYTQFVDDLKEPIQYRIIDNSNTPLIAGTFSTLGIDTSGGFHIKIKMKPHEAVSVLGSVGRQGIVFYAEMPSGIVHTTWQETQLKHTESLMFDTTYVINVAPVTVTNASEVKFRIPVYKIIDGDNASFLDIPPYPLEKVVTFNHLSNLVMMNGAFRDDSTINYSGEYRTSYPIPINNNYPIMVEGSSLQGKAFFDINYKFISLLMQPSGTVITPESIPSNAAFVAVAFGTADTVTVTYTVGGGSWATNSETQAARGLSVVVPPVVPVAVGVQMNLYYDNMRTNMQPDKTVLHISEGADPKNGSFPHTYKTRQTERALQYLPTVSGETLNMEASLRSADGSIVGDTQDFELLSVPNNNGAGRRKITLICGDSQVDGLPDTNNPVFAPYIKKLFDDAADMDMLFIGNRSFSAITYGETESANVTTTAYAAAQGGRTVDWFYGNLSPFWNAATSKIDFSNYISNLAAGSNASLGLVAGDKIDYFIFPMGINDYIQGASDETIIERIKTMQNLVWAHSPNCKFIVGLPTQGTATWSMLKRRKWNIEFYDKLITEFTKPEYTDKVYISSAGLWTDNLYGSRSRRIVKNPYSRINESFNLLVNKYMQTKSLTKEQATEYVINETGLNVQELVLERWQEEFPSTADIVHSGYVAAMQQADCYYSTLRYLLDIN